MYLLTLSFVRYLHHIIGNVFKPDLNYLQRVSTPRHIDYFFSFFPTSLDFMSELKPFDCNE